MLWISSEKLYHLSKETRMKRKRKAFVEVLEKVKLVLISIRFKLDISMQVMVTNPSIRFGTWHWVLPRIIGSGKVGYPLSNGYGHPSYYTILINFYFYLQYFQQKNFNFSKISKFQTDPKYLRGYDMFKLWKIVKEKLGWLRKWPLNPNLR